MDEQGQQEKRKEPHLLGPGETTPCKTQASFGLSRP